MSQKNSKSYRPDIDGLRALAVLAVLLFHARLGCPGGFVGVDIFFVISGFLITSLIVKELGEGTFSLISFWERRIRRILPAVVLVALATLAAGWCFFLPKDFELMGKSLVAQAALLSNVFFYRQGLAGGGYFANASEAKPLLHTWSLAVEEQFYLLFPLLLILLARYKAITYAKAIAMLAIGSFLLCVVGSYTHTEATFYLLPARAWELLLGALLSIMRGQFVAGRLLRETSGWLGLGLIGYSIFGYNGDTRFPGIAAVPPCAGAALIILSSEVESSFVGRMLALKPVVFIGLISYSLYLWHWPLLVFPKYLAPIEPGPGTRSALLAASSILAILSWKYVETPFRKRWILQRRLQIFVFAGVSTFTLLVIGFSVFRSHGFPSRIPAKAIHFAESRNHTAFRSEVSLEQALAGQFMELGSEETNQTISILIWGDSHAMSLAPLIDDLCRQYSQRGIQATHSATAPVVGYVGRLKCGSVKLGLLEETPAYSSAVLKFIAQKHVRNVILAAWWSAYPAFDSSHAPLFKTQLLATIRAIKDSGARVYVVKDVPQPGFNVPRIASLAVICNRDLDQLGITREKHQEADRELVGTFEQISQMGVTVLDPANYFLNRNSLYGVLRNDQILYCDEQHLTVEGSKILAPLFEPIFKDNEQGFPNQTYRMTDPLGSKPR